MDKSRVGDLLGLAEGAERIDDRAEEGGVPLEGFGGVGDVEGGDSVVEWFDMVVEGEVDGAVVVANADDWGVVGVESFVAVVFELDDIPLAFRQLAASDAEASLAVEISGVLVA